MRILQNGVAYSDEKESILFMRSQICIPNIYKCSRFYTNTLCEKKEETA